MAVIIYYTVMHSCGIYDLATPDLSWPSLHIRSLVAKDSSVARGENPNNDLKLACSDDWLPVDSASLEAYIINNQQTNHDEPCIILDLSLFSSIAILSHKHMYID